MAEAEAVLAAEDEGQAEIGDDRHREVHRRAAAVHRAAAELHDRAADLQREHAAHERPSSRVS